MNQKYTTKTKKSSDDPQSSLNKVKRKIIDLIASNLNNKFIKIFKEKSYTEKNLKNDLDSLITEKEIRNFKYEDAINGIEKNILNKVNEMPVILKKESIAILNPINHSIEKNNSYNKISPNQNEISKIQNSQSESPYSSNLLKKLHLKENDEWAQIVKNNHLDFLQQQKEKTQKNLELKKSTKEYYEMQMNEKELKKKLEHDDLNKYVRYRDENLKKMEDTEKMYKEEAKRKVKSQKELKHKMLNEFYDLKKSQQLKEEIEQKVYLDYIILKKKEDEERKFRKKEVVKDIYKNVYEQIENKIEMKKIEREKEKFENLKKLEDYSKILEQRDNERFKTIYDSLKRFEKKCEIEERKDFKFEDREELKNKLAEKRYREQSIEKEIR